MKVEPLKLKSFGDGLLAESAAAGGRVFIPNARPPEPEAPPPPPSFSESDMKAAERDGFQKGFLEGTKEGRQQVENEEAAINAQVAALAGKFAASISPILAHYQQFAANVQAEMPKIALAIAQKVAGPALDENAHLLVADIATRACESMMSEPKLTITAHESLGNTLEKMLSTLASRLPEHTEIIILRDPDMPKADCRIDWKHGSMQHSVQELWERIEKAVDNLTATSKRDGTVELQQLEEQLFPGRAAEAAQAAQVIMEEATEPKNEQE